MMCSRSISASERPEADSPVSFKLKSEAWSSGPDPTTMARSTAFSSSRTFPGQE